MSEHPLTASEFNAFVKSQLATHASVDEALAFVADYGRHNADWYRSRCENVFPLQSRTAGKMYRCLAFVQEIDAAVGMLSADPKSLFRDDTQAYQPSDEQLLFDTSTAYLVPIPGHTHSYNTVGGGHQQNISQVNRKKRELDADSATVEVVDEMPQQAEYQDAGAYVPDAVVRELNLPHRPLAQALASSCIAVTLGHKPGFRLHDVVEVFGFLQHDHDEKMDDFDDFSTWRARTLPGGLVANLLVAFHWPTTVGIPRACTAHSPIASRQLAIDYLATRLCFGDKLAAEYVLLTMISSVVARSNGVPVGDVPLYLWFDGVDAPPSLNAAVPLLAAVAPVGCVGVSLGVDSARLAPRMDHERNTMICGAFQVAGGTTIVLDAETGISSDSCAVDQLFNLLHRQKLSVDFVYSALELETDVNTIVVSSKSPKAGPAVLDLACCVRIVPCDHNCQSAAANEWEVLEAIAEYLASARCQFANRQLDLNDSLSDMISDDIALWAKTHPAMFNGDPLVHNNTINVVVALTRLYAASMGRTHVLLDDYFWVKESEAARHVRLRGCELSAT